MSFCVWWQDWNFDEGFIFILGREEVFFVGWTVFDMGLGGNLHLTNIATKISMTRI